MAPEVLSAFFSIKTESKSTLDSGPNLRETWRAQKSNSAGWTYVLCLWISWTRDKEYRLFLTLLHRNWRGLTELFMLDSFYL